MRCQPIGSIETCLKYRTVCLLNRQDQAKLGKRLFWDNLGLELSSKVPAVTIWNARIAFRN